MLLTVTIQLNYGRRGRFKQKVAKFAKLNPVTFAFFAIFCSFPVPSILCARPPLEGSVVYSDLVTAAPEPERRHHLDGMDGGF